MKVWPIGCCLGVLGGKIAESVADSKMVIGIQISPRVAGLRAVTGLAALKTMVTRKTKEPITAARPDIGAGEGSSSVPGAFPENSRGCDPEARISASTSARRGNAWSRRFSGRNAPMSG